MRVKVYVDGFNLYYGLRGESGRRWLDLSALFARVLPDDEVVGIEYFTALVKPEPGDPGKRDRQRLYVRALQTIPHLEVHYGLFLRKKKTRPLVAPAPDEEPIRRFKDWEEKGSDVNLASRLLVDGFTGEYEAAAVVSNDGDLKMPVEIVREVLQRPVTVINPRNSRRSAALSPDPLPENARYIRLSMTDIEESQFSEAVATAAGRELVKPEGW